MSRTRIGTGSIAQNLSLFESGSMDAWRQGLDVNSIDTLVRFATPKIRPNSEFGVSIDGVKQSRNRIFNDELTSVGIHSSGSLKGSTARTLDTKIRYGNYVSFEAEQRELGQSELYESGEYSPFNEDIEIATNAVSLLSMSPFDLFVPIQLTFCSLPIQNDGIIEPLTIRRNLDRSTTERPFSSHDIRGSLGIDEDVRRSSISLSDESEKIISSYEPYLDSVETIGSLVIPGIVWDTITHIFPYEDRRSQDFEFSTLLDAAMNAIVSSVTSTLTPTLALFGKKSAQKGFVYENSPMGTDSLAFGGLRR